MLTLLRDAWKDVEKCYRQEEINSEHSLQAVLYHALRPRLPKDHVILVEPGSLDGGIPDLLIRDAEAVKCIVEIKCAPHWWVPSDRLRYDLHKLVEYSRKRGTFELDIYGPDRFFDPSRQMWRVRDAKTDVWRDGRDKFTMKKPWFAFASLTRNNDRASKGI